MKTTKEELLKLKYGEWIIINALRDKKEVSQLVNELNQSGKDFRINDDVTKIMQLSSDLFDLKDKPGYSVVKRQLERGKMAEDLYFNNQLIAIR